MSAAVPPERLRAPERILVRLPTWVGDLVMSTPALRAIKRAHAGAELVCVGRDFQADLIEGLPFVDRYLVAPREGVRGSWPWSRALRRERFDWAFLFGESERVALAPALARIPVRVGYGRGWLRRRLLTHFLERPRGDDGRPLAYSMIERYLEVTRHVGIPDAGTEMETPVSDAARASVRERLAAHGIGDDERIVTIIAGASFGAAKMWPPEQFAAACDALHERRGLRAVLAPGPGEESIGDAVARHSRHGIAVMLDPVFRLAQTAALLERSDLALSNDTGPRSIAVALGLPVVVPIGPTEDGHTRHHLERQRVLIEDVDCRPCRLRTCPIDHRCMTRITPERMVAAAEELLETVGPGVPVSSRA